MTTTRISPMVRTALFVADLDKSRHLYQNVLGLAEEWFSGELTDGNAHELLGMPAGSVTRASILKAPGPAWGMVGLFEVSSPRPPPLIRKPDSINAGETCLVFYCAKLDPVVESLDAEGLRILCRPLRLRIGEQTKQREMCFRDHDGVLINLIEWDPDEPRRPEQS